MSKLTHQLTSFFSTPIIGNCIAFMNHNFLCKCIKWFKNWNEDIHHLKFLGEISTERDDDDMFSFVNRHLAGGNFETNSWLERVVLIGVKSVPKKIELITQSGKLSQGCFGSSFLNFKVNIERKKQHYNTLMNLAYRHNLANRKELWLLYWEKYKKKNIYDRLKIRWLI